LQSQTKRESKDKKPEAISGGKKEEFTLVRKRKAIKSAPRGNGEKFLKKIDNHVA
jgi:hypothetical protein